MRFDNRVDDPNNDVRIWLGNRCSVRLSYERAKSVLNPESPRMQAMGAPRRARDSLKAPS